MSSPVFAPVILRLSQGTLILRSSIPAIVAAVWDEINSCCWFDFPRTPLATSHPFHLQPPARSLLQYVFTRTTESRHRSSYSRLYESTSVSLASVSHYNNFAQLATHMANANAVSDILASSDDSLFPNTVDWDVAQAVSETLDLLNE